MKTATLIKTDGTVTEVTPKNGKKFTLDELYAFIGGHPAGFTPLPSGKMLVVHDEGKLIGLPINEKATELWKKEYPISKYPLNNDELIVGDVLLSTRGLL